LLLRARLSRGVAGGAEVRAVPMPRPVTGRPASVLLAQIRRGARRRAFAFARGTIVRASPARRDQSACAISS
jgi:hypothetical protein